MAVEPKTAPKPEDRLSTTPVIALVMLSDGSIRDRTQGGAIVLIFALFGVANCQDMNDPVVGSPLG